MLVTLTMAEAPMMFVGTRTPSKVYGDGGWWTRQATCKKIHVASAEDARCAQCVSAWRVREILIFVPTALLHP